MSNICAEKAVLFFLNYTLIWEFGSQSVCVCVRVWEVDCECCLDVCPEACLSSLTNPSLIELAYSHEKQHSGLCVSLKRHACLFQLIKIEHI